MLLTNKFCEVDAPLILLLKELSAAYELEYQNG
jgi:hypothetical protein